MKLKHFPLNLLLLTGAVALLSCDGKDVISGDRPEKELDEVAESLDEVIANDRIDFTPIENLTSFVEPLNLIFTGLTGKENGLATAPTYNYDKSNTFEFELTTQDTSTLNLQRSLDNTLGSPSPIGTRFREIILRSTAEFSDEELAEIVEILNPAGASLFFDNENPSTILIITGITLTQKVTSNNRDLLAGTMRGTYILDSSSAELSFRAPTPLELNKYRLLTPNHQIPFITDLRLNARGGVGAWVLSLANR